MYLRVKLIFILVKISKPKLRDISVVIPKLASWSLTSLMTSGMLKLIKNFKTMNKYFLNIKQDTYEIIPCVLVKNLPNQESEISYQKYIPEAKYKKDDYGDWELVHLDIHESKNPKFEKRTTRVKTIRLFDTAEKAKLGLLDFLTEKKILIETEPFIKTSEETLKVAVEQFTNNQKFTFNLDSTINFGKKHKGALIKDVVKEDYQYYKWLISVGYKMSQELQDYVDNLRNPKSKSYDYTPPAWEKTGWSVANSSRSNGGWESVNELEADAWGGCCPNM